MPGSAIGYSPGAADPRHLLFTPGPRLGWVFRDRRELVTPYPEPEPDPRAITARAARRAAEADQELARAWKWFGRPSIGLALVLIVLAGCSKAVSGSYDVGATAIAIVVLCFPGLGYAGWCWHRRDQVRKAAPDQEYRRAMAAWDERAAGHEAAEAARVGRQPEWGSVTAPARRTDVFGGTLAGWQGLLTVHGASLLAQQPLLVADLTGQYAAVALMRAAQAARISAVAYRLPHDLGRSGLLGELAPAQLATAVAEAIHAGTPPSARTDRAVDVRVLQQLASALASRGVTPRRLAAAVRAALGNTGLGGPVPESIIPGSVLTPAEEEFIAGDLFPAGYREQVTASLIRLDAVLADLAAYAGDGWPAGPARLTCLAVDPAARSASGEVLTGLVVQWLTVQATLSGTSAHGGTAHGGTAYDGTAYDGTAPGAARPAGVPNAPAVVIAGADEIARAHAERLADACEAHGVPLTLMFRHLRDDAASLLGGGTAAFMRLGNHAEAEQAASYIGHRHTFVVSSFTATRGGSQTATYGGSESFQSGDNTSTARSRGWSERPDGGWFSGRLGSGGRTQTQGTSTSRTQGTSWSQADGTSWSDAEARQRVYEFAVEPTVLQNLPDHAILLADRTGTSLRLRAIECDPEIITLPGTSTAPLPAVAVPPAAGSAYPALHPGGMRHDAMYPGAISPGTAPMYPGPMHPSGPYPSGPYPGGPYPSGAYPPGEYPGSPHPGGEYRGGPHPGSAYPGSAYPVAGPAALDQPVPPPAAGQYTDPRYPGSQYPGSQYPDEDYPGGEHAPGQQPPAPPSSGWPGKPPEPPASQRPWWQRNDPPAQQP